MMTVVCESLQKAKCITKTTWREEYIYKTYQWQKENKFEKQKKDKKVKKKNEPNKTK
jgi:hypothetical protein